jgi:predicted O-methyltransferase YrrM
MGHGLPCFVVVLVREYTIGLGREIVDANSGCRKTHHAEIARRNFVNAKLADRIELHVGPALESLARLRAEGVAPFDLVFIDADKANNLKYVQGALELSKIGTLIMVDNVVREGSVVSPKHDEAVQGVRKMTAWIGAQSRLAATVIQTVGVKGYDGFLLTRVQAI